MTYQRTSLKALLSVEPHIGSINRAVYSYIQSRGLDGATDQEVESITRIDGNSVRPSRGSLVKQGLVFDSGRTRPNAKGNNCIVWIALDEGMML